MQGFTWDNLAYSFPNDAGNEKTEIILGLDEKTYKVLALRYKELFGSGNGSGDSDLPYDIDGYLTTIDTEAIDADYMNSRFDKYFKLLHQQGTSAELIKQAEDELHKTFATLSQEEQKFANIFLHDIQRGDIVPQPEKTLRDYIAEYQTKAKDDQIHRISNTLGLDEEQLRFLMARRVTDGNINEYGRFDTLKSSVDRIKAKAYFELLEGIRIIPPKVNIKVDKLLRDFIISGGFDIETRDESD